MLRFVIVLLLSAMPTVVLAQAGMRESLERLDVNQNGLIEPNEITTLSRPFLERIAKQRRLRLNKPIAISEYLLAARIYYSSKNGSASGGVDATNNGTVKGFGANSVEKLVPGFGARIKYQYTQEDLNQAERTLRRSDDDNDGFIDRREAQDAYWQQRNPFADDLNGDQKLGKIELAQRYARRRLLRGANAELIRKAVRTGGEIQDSRIKKDQPTKQQPEKWWQRDGKSQWLSNAMISRFDADKNGVLDQTEARKLGISMSAVDLDQDGAISRDELFGYLGPLQDKAGDQTLGLPGWFFELDQNADQQISLSEFAADSTVARREEFYNLDANMDGLLTSTEVLTARSVIGGIFKNDEGTLLTPQRTMISEIEIEEDVWIQHLKVQLQITHTSVSQLDVYLAGPDGKKVELFTQIGGSGQHFDGMILDDQASTPVVKARSPFNKSYQPEAIKNGEPGLSQWKETSAKGVWQLIVRATRSDRFGMLHEWNLQIKTLEDIPRLTPEKTETDDSADESQENLETGKPATDKSQPVEKSKQQEPSDTKSPSTPKTQPSKPIIENPILKWFGGGLS